jgi:CheY-like chemotaxis protein
LLLTARHSICCAFLVQDIHMPVMGGLEACLQLRGRGFTGPIIALTANAMKEVRIIVL